MFFIIIIIVSINCELLALLVIENHRIFVSNTSNREKSITLKLKICVLKENLKFHKIMLIFAQTFT